MQRPSLRQLEVVLALAEHLSFRKAAEACGITQPALSQQLQQLENVIGFRVFERDRRHVVPTPAGAELVEHARRALLEIDAFVEAARGFREPLAGPLRMGVIPTVAPYVLPVVVPRLRRAFPRLKLFLHEAQTSRLVELLRGGKLDLALLALEADLGELESEPLYSDPFVVAAPQGHPLAARASVREADLADGEVLLLADGHCLREQALDLCRRARAHEAGDFRATSLNTLVRMVAGGTGITLLPAMSVASEVHAQDRLRVLAFAGSKPARTIGLVWRRSSPRKTEYAELVALLRRHPPEGVTALTSARGASRAPRGPLPSPGS
jgi:LysR family hydrogen peroxide-inducible transcriptional activator